MIETRRQQHLRLNKLEEEVQLLKQQLAQVSVGQSVTVPVTTFAPEPFDLLGTIFVVVQQVGDEYVASFFDANINASGSTETDAVANLKDVMLSVFEHLSSLPKKKLGPGPIRQLAVLNEFIRSRP